MTIYFSEMRMNERKKDPNYNKKDPEVLMDQLLIEIRKQKGTAKKEELAKKRFHRCGIPAQLKQKSKKSSESSDDDEVVIAGIAGFLLGGIL
jgi:hypothetical protein